MHTGTQRYRNIITTEVCDCLGVLNDCLDCMILCMILYICYILCCANINHQCVCCFHCRSSFVLWLRGCVLNTAHHYHCQLYSTSSCFINVWNEVRRMVHFHKKKKIINMSCPLTYTSPAPHGVGGNTLQQCITFRSVLFLTEKESVSEIITRQECTTY